MNSSCTQYWNYFAEHIIRSYKYLQSLSINNALNTHNTMQREFFKILATNSRGFVQRLKLTNWLWRIAATWQKVEHYTAYTCPQVLVSPLWAHKADIVSTRQWRGLLVRLVLAFKYSKTQALDKQQTIQTTQDTRWVREKIIRMKRLQVVAKSGWNSAYNTATGASSRRLRRKQTTGKFQIRLTSGLSARNMSPTVGRQ